MTILTYSSAGSASSSGRCFAATGSTLGAGWVVQGATATIGAVEFGKQSLLDEVTKRVVELEAAFYEDYEKALDVTSRKAFECFMQYSAKKMPVFAAESTGHLVATWKNGQERLIIRFKSRYYYDYALTYVRDDVVQRTWGVSTLVTIADIFAKCPEARHLIA